MFCFDLDFLLKGTSKVIQNSTISCVLSVTSNFAKMKRKKIETELFNFIPTQTRK